MNRIQYRYTHTAVAVLSEGVTLASILTGLVDGLQRLAFCHLLSYKEELHSRGHGRGIPLFISIKGGRIGQV